MCPARYEIQLVIYTLPGSPLTMPGLPADHVLTIIRIKQWQQDRAALATSRTTDYTRTGWKQRNHRAADARIVRVLDFERAFDLLEEEHQLALALALPSCAGATTNPRTKPPTPSAAASANSATCYPRPART
jgi:hypothetical protein